MEWRLEERRWSFGDRIRQFDLNILPGFIRILPVLEGGWQWQKKKDDSQGGDFGIDFVIDPPILGNLYTYNSCFAVCHWIDLSSQGGSGRTSQKLPREAGVAFTKIQHTQLNYGWMIHHNTLHDTHTLIKYTNLTKILMIKTLKAGCLVALFSVQFSPVQRPVQVISRRKTPLRAVPKVSHCLAQGHGHQTYTGNTGNTANAASTQPSHN